MNLNEPGASLSLKKRISEKIDEFCIQKFGESEPRRHLGASVIGHECSRYLWYNFRWCVEDNDDFSDKSGEEPVYTRENHARALRLFNRGHLEENRFVSYLRGIGCKVSTHEFPPEFDKYGNQITEGKQWRIAPPELHGHFGGSLDAIITFPEEWDIEPRSVLGEFKTSNAKQFEKLIKEGTGGMRLAKHQHFVQASIYGKHYGLTHCLYCVTCKDDDRLWLELVKLNPNTADTSVEKAKRIIFATEPPSKLSSDPKFWQCKYCSASQVCHKDRLPLRNCRSCKFSQPIQDKQWGCNKWDAVIPDSEIIKGCPSWHPITRP